MNHNLQISGRLNRLVDWFIPPEFAADRDARKQASLFLFSHLFGPFIGNVVPAAIYVLDPDPTYDVVVLAISISAFWAFPFLLRAYGRYNLLVLMSVQNLIFCILWSCYFYGGVTSPTLPWVVTIPLLAFFYVGPHSPPLRVAVLSLFVLNAAIFAGANLLYPTGGKHLPLLSLQGLGIVSTTCTAMYVSMMAIYYASIVASGAGLETEMKQHLVTATELRRATVDAERAGAAKAEFLAKMSHELRTPLNAVIGYSQLLLEDAGPEDDVLVADLQRILRSGRQLLKLINQILELSKIEAGKLDLLIERVEVASVVTQVAEECREAAEKNGNELVLDLVGDPGAFACDRGKLQTAIILLLDNAAKFTKNGRITITASRKTGPTGEVVIFAIRDTGIGIAPNAIASLFEKFTVAEDSSSSKYGGTGLGLALSRKICQLMGGDITAESEIGIGSCFTIRFPTGQPAVAVDARAARQQDPAPEPGNVWVEPIRGALA